jgi:hypothetical protein
MDRRDEANSRLSKFCERTDDLGVNLVDDVASLRSTLYRCNTNCWVEVLDCRWVWATSAVNPLKTKRICFI